MSCVVHCWVLIKAAINTSQIELFFKLQYINNHFLAGQTQIFLNIVLKITINITSTHENQTGYLFNKTAKYAFRYLLLKNSFKRYIKLQSSTAHKKVVLKFLSVNKY